MKISKLFGGIAVVCAVAIIPLARADLYNLTDTNPDANILEFNVSSVETDVTINGTNVHAFVFKDENGAAQPASGGIPIPVIKAKVGDLIICHYTNKFSGESASIHWHGIELDNDSDGTAVTQDAVLPGQAYTYRFETFRPGVYWFHSHMLPGTTLFGGMYGILIIENNIEASLVASGVLPDAAHTHTIAMSDIDFDATGKVGKEHGGTTHSLNELIELCHLFGIGEPGGENTCNTATMPGKTVLTNGRGPDVAAQTPKFTVPSGKRVRLRLLNESISRHFRVKLINSGDNKLYRIGGQGGLLDNIVLEGGTKGTWNTLYDPGEILLGSGMRADVLVYPTGAEGSIITLVGNKTTGTFQISGGLPTDYPIAYFEISGMASDPAPAEGQPILAGTAEDIESIKTGVTVVSLEEPAPHGGSSDETIRLTTEPPTGPVAPFAKNQPGVDQFAAPLDVNAGNGDWMAVPRTQVARYAHVGDVLELKVRNETGSAHPYHLHGFSMQPLRMESNAGEVLYEFPYEEWVDTVDVYGGQTYVFRVRVDDRPKYCDITPNSPPDGGPLLAECEPNPCGGVVGRWLFHCHIVSHGALGMIGEVTILPTPDNPPEIVCPADIAQDNDPGECSAVVVFEDPMAMDDCGDVTVVCDPPSGSTFPVGTTVVTCTATDSGGQMTQCTFNVTVNDVEKPVITSAVTTAELWSPNHDMINVGFTASATDNCDAPVTLSVVVYSDEDDEMATGDGNFSPDALNVASGTLRLRSERVGSRDGRVYLIMITATDGAGNQAKASHTVIVSKANAEKFSASVIAQAAAAKAYFDANGTPPAGFVLVGDGPVVGTKQ